MRLIRPAIIAAASGQGGRQADVLPLYFDGGGEPVVRGPAWGYRIGPALEHDAPDLTIDGTGRGLGPPAGRAPPLAGRGRPAPR